MMKAHFFFSGIVGYFLLMLLIVEETSAVDISLDNNFESGTLLPWIEQSTTGVKWKIENRNSPFETDNLAPLPSNGTNYLRVDRGTSLAFGVAILRSQVFTILPGSDTTFSFSFWIRSKWPQFTNLELYVAKNGNEVLLLNLYEYSDVNNRDWQSQTVLITDDSSSNLTLVFYAYCGTDTEDAVAIDDLRFITLQQSTSTTSTETTTPSTTWIFTTSSETELTTLTDFETSTTTSPKTTRPSITIPSTITGRLTTKSSTLTSTYSTDATTADPSMPPKASSATQICFHFCLLCVPFFLYTFY